MKNVQGWRIESLLPILPRLLLFHQYFMLANSIPTRKETDKETRRNKTFPIHSNNKICIGLHLYLLFSEDKAPETKKYKNSAQQLQDATQEQLTIINISLFIQPDDYDAFGVIRPHRRHLAPG